MISIITVSNFCPQIKIAALLMMVGACLTYPTDEVKPPTVNAVPDNVQTNPVPNQSKPEQSPVPVPAPIPEQENPLAKPEKDLTTDNSFWWGKSYYPIRRSYYYYPR